MWKRPRVIGALFYGLHGTTGKLMKYGIDLLPSVHLVYNCMLNGATTQMIGRYDCELGPSSKEPFRTFTHLLLIQG